MSARQGGRRWLVLHGPNAELALEADGLGTLAQLDARLSTRARALGGSVRAVRARDEGALADALREERGRAAGVLLDVGGLAFQSHVLREALELSGLPAVEVHTRAQGGRPSLLAGTARARVEGRGTDGFVEALERLAASGEAPIGAKTLGRGAAAEPAAAGAAKTLGRRTAAEPAAARPSKTLGRAAAQARGRDVMPDRGGGEATQATGRHAGAASPATGRGAGEAMRSNKTLGRRAEPARAATGAGKTLGRATGRGAAGDDAAAGGARATGGGKGVAAASTAAAGDKTLGRTAAASSAAGGKTLGRARTDAGTGKTPGRARTAGDKTLGRKAGARGGADADEGLTRAKVRLQLAERLARRLSPHGLAAWARTEYLALHDGGPAEEGAREELDEVLQRLAVSGHPGGALSDDALLGLMARLDT